MVLPQDVLGGCRPWGGCQHVKACLGAGWGMIHFRVSQLIRLLLLTVAGKPQCLLAKVFPWTACLSLQHGGWISPKQASLRDRKMENTLFFIPSLGSPIPSLLWCPVGNTTQPCSLCVVTVQGHRYQEARIWGDYLGGLATIEGCLIFFFFSS